MIDTELVPYAAPPQAAHEPLPPVDFGTARRAAELALRLGDVDIALRAGHGLLRAFPDAASPLALLGHALLEAGDPYAASDYFRHALELNPLDAGAWAGLAGALASTGSPEATEALERAALHDPLGSEGLAPGVAAAPALGLGVVYLCRGMPTLAAAELQQAVAFNPGRDDLRAHYAEALRRAGNLNEARRQLRALEQSSPLALPTVLLGAALAGEADARALRTLCAHHDPDGAITRRFFAPENPPWELPATPKIPSDHDLELLKPYLHLVGGQKARSSHLPPAEDSSPHAPVASKRSPSSAPRRAPVELDPDVRSYIATTDQLRHRIADVGGGPRPLAPWSSGLPLAQVILSSRAGLRRRFGEAGLAAVNLRLRTLTDALRRRGLHTDLCYLDDATSLRTPEGDTIAPVAADPTAIRELVQSLAEAHAGRGRELRVLLIIGGDDVVPFHRLPNPIPDDDPLVLSDNPYASDDAGHAVPQRIVARVPEGAGSDPALLLTILDSMIAHHNGERPRARLMLPLRQAHKAPRTEIVGGYAAEIWGETSREALDAIEPRAQLRFSPPLTAGDFDRQPLAARRLLYINLHGAQGLPNFYGQPDSPWSGPATKLPVALRPDQINGAVAGGMLLMEACYGAELAGRTPANSIPLRALASGALACVGATVNAYGSSQTPLVAADLLFQRMLAQLANGSPLGEALHHARHEFAQEMYRRQGYLDDVDVKTLIEFVLLGDPWAVLESGGDGRQPWPASRIAGIERVPKPRPKAVLTESDVPLDLVRLAREALRRVMPGAGVAPLLITAQQNPRRQRKGDPEQNLVFSARENHATADGYYVTQAAHVTLNGKAVVKMVHTR
ncbi:MAG: hypothetical protein RLZZ387_1575 [Chloroflexota bacterium]